MRTPKNSRKYSKDLKRQQLLALALYLKFNSIVHLNYLKTRLDYFRN